MPKKQIAILIASSLTSLMFWLAVKPWITDPTWSTVDYGTWLAPLLALMLMGAVTATAFILLDSYRLRFAASGIIGLLFLLIFGITKVNLLGVAIMLALHYRAMRSMSSAIRNHLKIDFRAGVNHGIRSVIIPLLIMLSFVYFENPDVQASARQNSLPAPIMKAVEGASRLITRSELNSLPQTQREIIERQLIRETTDLLTRQARPYRQYFPPILAFGLFIVLQGLGFIFIPVARYVAWGLFEGLKAMKFVAITERDVKAEELRM